MAQKRFVLIDSNSLIHRAYHAYPADLATSKGEQTNAVYGFTAILLKVIDDFEPDYLICVFDTDKPTHRHKKFKEYKIQRKPMDEELVNQLPRIRQVVKAFNIPLLEADGFEADDVIGTLEGDKKLKEYEKIIVSGDHDMFQLADHDTKIFISGRSFRDSNLYGPKEVEKKLGIKPEQVVDYKALYGDPSDNIPGVAGVGKKGALNLIKEYKNLDNLYKSIGKVGGRYRKKLEKGKEDAELSKELATISRDAPIDYDVKGAKWGDFDAQKVRSLFQELEFRSLLKRLNEITKEQKDLLGEDLFNKNETNEFEIEKVDTKSAWNDLCKKLGSEKRIFYSILSSSPHPIDSTPISLEFFYKGKIYTVESGLFSDESGLSGSAKNLKKLFEDNNIEKVGFDVKSDMHSLASKNIKIVNYFDTQICGYMLQGGEGKATFVDMVFSYFGKMYDKIVNEKAVGPRNSEEDFRKYRGVRSCYTKKLYDKFVSQIADFDNKNEWNCNKLFEEIETPLIKVLFKMEEFGIKVDQKYLEKFKDEIEEKLEKLKKKIFHYVGHEFNVDSPKQVGEVLFDELDLGKASRTRKGNVSTRSEVLKKLKGTHPVVDEILEYREVSKIASTYTDSLIDCIYKDTGRIHTTFNQAVTATGRLSSTDPNLQNIPISTEAGKKIRKAFVAPRSSELISFDYAQQELRILAHITGEKNLIEAFENDIDVHALTASKIFDKDIEDVGDKERGVGKTVNYGVMYGMGERGLARLIKVKVDKADNFIKKYFEAYSGVKEYFDDYLNKVEKEGYAETLFGRRRQVKGLSSSNYAQRNTRIRELINFPMQGAAADMMKYAMVQIDELIEDKYSNKAKMLLQVHDELIFECNSSINMDEFAKEVENIMEGVYDLCVPIKVEHSRGKSWYEIH